VFFSSPAPFTWGRKQSQLPKRCDFNFLNIFNILLVRRWIKPINPSPRSINICFTFNARNVVRFRAGAIQLSFLRKLRDWLWAPPSFLCRGYHRHCSCGRSVWGRKITSHIHRLQRLNRNGAIPLLLHTPSRYAQGPLDIYP
jgi:hypothetical protein